MLFLTGKMSNKNAKGIDLFSTEITT